MIKKVFVLLVLMAAPAIVFAQLKVKSDGRVVAGTEFQTSSNYNIGFQSGIQTTNTNTIVAVYGRANSSYYGATYGMYGVADNSYGLSNFGVYGTLDNNSYGVGVYGGTFVQGGIGFSQQYAGYFWGNTCVNGTLTATSVVQSSDIRLKENIISLGSRNESVLDKVLDMNVIEYNYKKNIIPGVILPDSVSAEALQKKAGVKLGKKHIGLIAQELQELFPTLVEEGQDGYLAVNYIELVPVLIRAIQELKQELDEVKGDSEFKTRSADDITAGFSAINTGNVLYQNNPNPFKEQTVIRFKLADNIQEAAICIFDMTGKTIKKLPISSGMESVSVGGYELGEGMFLYSLIVNGKEIDTKRMIISK